MEMIFLNKACQAADVLLIAFSSSIPFNDTIQLCLAFKVSMTRLQIPTKLSAHAPLFSQQVILDRVNQLADKIDRDVATLDQPLTLLITLCGAWHFGSALSLALQTPHHVAFVQAKSYTHTSRSGEPVTLNWVTPVVQLKGRRILLVEDIVDSGHTLQTLTQHLRSEPAFHYWKTITLLDKPEARQVDIQADYVGFTVDTDAFVIGYGLDLDNAYRDLPFITVYQP
jgi:hypoxanthine phosphoribosyltransferase